MGKKGKLKVRGELVRGRLAVEWKERNKQENRRNDEGFQGSKRGNSWGRRINVPPTRPWICTQYVC